MAWGRIKAGSWQSSSRMRICWRMWTDSWCSVYQTSYAALQLTVRPQLTSHSPLRACTVRRFEKVWLCTDPDKQHRAHDYAAMLAELSILYVPRDPWESVMQQCNMRMGVFATPWWQIASTVWWSHCDLCVATAPGGQAFQTEDLRYGLRVSIVGLPAHPLLRTPEALAVVGPAAFGFEGVEYMPLGDYRVWPPFIL